MLYKAPLVNDEYKVVDLIDKIKRFYEYVK